MNCVNHPDREAVGQCQGCGAELCAECYSYFNPHLCYDCACKLAKEDQRSFHKALTLGIIAALIGLGAGILFWVANPAITVGVGLFFCLWFMMSGVTLGLSLSANAHKKKDFWTWVGAFFFSLIVAPVAFVIYLVKTIKLAKILKQDKAILAGYFAQAPLTEPLPAIAPLSEPLPAKAVISEELPPVEVAASGPFHCLFDPSYLGDITFFIEEKRPQSFAQGGLLPLRGKTYAILQPRPLPQGMGENEALVYEILEDETNLENSQIRPVEDPALIAEVFAGLKGEVIASEIPSASPGVAAPKRNPRRVKWWIYLILAVVPFIGWGLYGASFLLKAEQAPGMGWLYFTLASAATLSFVLALGLLLKRLGDIARWRVFVFPLLGVLLLGGALASFYLLGYGAQSFAGHQGDTWGSAIAIGATYGPYVLVITLLPYVRLKDGGGKGSVVLFFICYALSWCLGAVVGVIVAVIVLVLIIIAVFALIFTIFSGSRPSNDNKETYKIDGKDAEATGPNTFKDSSGDTWERTGSGDEVKKVD